MIDLTGCTRSCNNDGRRMIHCDVCRPIYEASKKAAEGPKPKRRADNVASEPTKEELLAELHSMIGLERVKREVAELASTIEFNKQRAAAGFPTPSSTRHMVFRGSPGTGKTTVARLLSKIFKAMGILSKGHFVEKKEGELCGQHVGDAAMNTAAACKEALGGILFIDEAYSLNDKKGFGPKVIESLLTFLVDYKADMIVIIAGYDKPMDAFLASNPGLKSRFPNDIHFEDYNPEQLISIFMRTTEKNKIQLTAGAHAKLSAAMHAMYTARGPAFGNARAAENLFERAYRNMSTRKSADVSTMIADDITV